MNKIFLGVCFCIVFNVRAQKKEVSLTIDDLPVVTYRLKDTTLQKHITLKLLSTLKARNVPVVGFVNEIKLYNGDTLLKIQLSFLEDWLKFGHHLGNHTFSHLDYHTTSMLNFAKDIVKGEKISKQLSMIYKKEFKYFRHPYLHVGESQMAYDSLNLFLKGNDYKVAPVTTDNVDYLFAEAYDFAIIVGDSALMKKIGNDYLIYMENKLKYYENLTKKVFNRNIKQVLLIHASALNAEYLDSLIKIYKRNNYKFITLDNALKDNAYTQELQNLGHGEFHG